MRDANQRIGRQGEAHAADHLRSMGYKILVRNYRTRHGEIDLIGAGSHGRFVLDNGNSCRLMGVEDDSNVFAQKFSGVFCGGIF